MANGGEAKTSTSGLGLPLGLLLAVLAVLAGAVMWLSVESVDEGAPPPSVGASVTLGGRAAPAAAAKPGGSKTTSPAATAPPETAGPAAPEAAAPPTMPQAAAPAAEPATPPAAEPATPPAAESAAPPARSAALPPLPPQFRLPRLANGPPLAAAPDPALVEHSRIGPLPVIGPHGRKPWRVYARPFKGAGAKPRVAIVVTALGLDAAATEAAIQGLPSAVTLAFTPYAPRLEQWVQRARAAGHEVLLDLPMEPEDYPEHDPGPKALLTSLSAAENGERLLWTLSRATGYVGVADFMGSRFTTSRQDLEPVLAALEKRGLLFLDGRTARQSVAGTVAREVGVAFASNTMFIDIVASPEAIDARLADIEGLAKSDGKAVGMATPYPVSLERIAAWSATLAKRGIALAPVSALAAGRAGG